MFTRQQSSKQTKETTVTATAYTINKIFEGAYDVVAIIYRYKKNIKQRKEESSHVFSSKLKDLEASKPPPRKRCALFLATNKLI